MPRKAKPKGEIEVLFGIKQVLTVGITLAILLGGAYFWGFETGHERALAGEPSLLAFLERSAAPRADSVRIPDILLEPVEDAPRRPSPPPAEPEPSARGAESPESGTPEPAKVASDRVKPQPGIKSRRSEPSSDAPRQAPSSNPSSAQAPERSPAKADSGGKLHYQVAALSMRQNAKSLVDWLRSEGFQAQILPARDGLFRVYVGPFRNDNDAASAKDRLSKDGFEPMARRL